MINVRNLNIRELLNSNPRISIYVISAVIFVALIFIVCTLLGTVGPHPPSKSYYSIDDGETYFIDDIEKIAPFEKSGKPAYRVALFRCGKGAKPFVAYLERYTSIAKARLEELRAKDPASGMMDPTVRGGIEVKKPGDKEWVKQSDYQKSQGIISPTCPEAAQALEPIFPP